MCPLDPIDMRCSTSVGDRDEAGGRGARRSLQRQHPPWLAPSQTPVLWTPPRRPALESARAALSKENLHMRRIGAVVALAMIAGAGCQKKTEEKQAPAAA